MIAGRKADWLSVLVVIAAMAALGVAIWGNLPEGGFHFWPFALAGLALVAAAVARTRNHWLWLAVPAFLSPMAVLITYVVAVMFGWRMSGL
jgi:hypothetical protein